MIDSADFDRDGRDDLLFRDQTTGGHVIWLMDGLAVADQFQQKQAINLPVVADGWEIVAAGDLDGDSKPDLLWHNAPLRATNVWTLDVTTLASTKRIATGGASPTPWRPMDIADINNDGRDDIIWQRATPAPARYTAWYKTNDSSLLTYTYGGLPYPATSAWQIKAFTDFDLDGKTDAFLLHTDGRRVIWRMDNKSLLKTLPIGQGNTTSTITLADVDDDGDRDLIYQAVADRGQTFVILMNKAELQGGLF